MKKLIKGIIDFRKKDLNDYRDVFAQLALGQSPDALFVACSDSRVVPNVFASINPGDLFVVRNVGNLIPTCCSPQYMQASAEACALEFALTHLPIRNIIVCGHSECAAMKALLNECQLQETFTRFWLQHANTSLEYLEKIHQYLIQYPEDLHNQLSQLNVLLQLEHLKTYPLVQDYLQTGKLKLHAWWFDIASAGVFYYDVNERQFILIDEAHGQQLLREIE